MYRQIPIACSSWLGLLFLLIAPHVAFAAQSISCLQIYNASHNAWIALNHYEDLRDNGSLAEAKKDWPSASRVYYEFQELVHSPANNNDICDNETDGLLFDVEARYKIDALRNGATPLSGDTLNDARQAVSDLADVVKLGWIEEPRVQDLTSTLHALYAQLHIQYPDQ